LFAAPDVRAAVIYSQPTLWAGNGTAIGTARSSYVDLTLTGFRTYDNFSLASPGTVNQVQWYGTYLSLDTTTGLFSSGAPNTQDWIIRFQADSAGSPAAVLATETLLDAAVTRQVLGTGFSATLPTLPNTTFTVYEFTAPFSPAFNATAGTPYWFSPLSRQPDTTSFFAWIEGTGGNGSSFQTQSTNGVVVGGGSVSGDRAFRLIDVPEPSTAGLMVGALLGLFLTGLHRRRRRGNSPVACYCRQP
jgi:hypothetical protein